MADTLAVQPITENDDAIKAAIEEAHLPSLIAALVHVTGDASLVSGDIKPVYDFFGDGQGGLTPEQITSTRRARWTPCGNIATAAASCRNSPVSIPCTR